MYLNDAFGTTDTKQGTRTNNIETHEKLAGKIGEALRTRKAAAINKTKKAKKSHTDSTQPLASSQKRTQMFT